MRGTHSLACHRTEQTWISESRRAAMDLPSLYIKPGELGRIQNHSVSFILSINVTESRARDRADPFTWKSDRPFPSIPESLFDRHPRVYGRKQRPPIKIYSQSNRACCLAFLVKILFSFFFSPILDYCFQFKRHHVLD